MSKSIRFTVTRDALLPALTTAKNAVERRSTIPILQNLRLDAEAERLTITGTDLDCEIWVSAPCVVDAAGSFTLPGANLFDAVRKLPEKAEISFETDGPSCQVKSGRTSFRMHVLPAADFPAMERAGMTARFELDAEAIRATLATVGFAVSSEETRYYLNGVHLHADEDRLVAGATDGHRLARVRLPLPAGAEGMPAIIVPRRTLDRIEDVIGDKGPVRIELSDRKILVAGGKGEMVSKLIDGTFPDYRRVIPGGNGNRFTLGRADLARAIDRVVTITPRGGAVKLSFDAEAGEVALATSNPEAGSAADSVALAKAEGNKVEIGFNGRYCLDMLAATEAESVTFELGTAGDPAVMRPAGDDADRPLFVIMPMRV